MKIPSINALTHKTRRGLTLIEVMISIAILAVLAVMLSTAFFYPRWLITVSALKQNAIHAGTDAIERLFAQDYATIPDDPAELDFSGAYEVNGRTVSNTVYSAVKDEDLPLRLIRVEVTYPGRNDPVILETYRSSLK
jgi:prepilin-type N-terminal cleavage/methylation domain-containing protein